MIVDEVGNAARYYALHPLLERGFEFLRQASLAEVLPGRHELDGDRLFVLVEHNRGRGRGGARLEAHRRYIDVQMTIRGREAIGWRPTADCRAVAEPYDAARDIEFFADAPQAWVALAPGQFMILFPEDAHAPLAAEGDNFKAVVKVAVESAR